uniref:BZIP domain-containing protein n=2 Tax=Bursaphelenchus xylophilus TaxID=6326 RepID=A0A1I7RTT1_BURXY
MHVIRIQTQPSQPSQQPSHIIIQGQQPQTATRTLTAAQAVLPAPSTSQPERVVPPRFKNLTDEQIARRRKANADRSRRRRAMETPEQRAERNRRTAERMRQRRAKIAEQRVPPPPPKVKTLSADRFEEIYRSVIGRACENTKDDSKSPEAEQKKSTEESPVDKSSEEGSVKDDSTKPTGYSPYQTSSSNGSTSGNIIHDQPSLKPEVSQT